MEKIINNKNIDSYVQQIETKGKYHTEQNETIIYFIKKYKAFTEESRKDLKLVFVSMYFFFFKMADDHEIHIKWLFEKLNLLIINDENSTKFDEFDEFDEISLQKIIE
jgi:hypothetical protein